MIIFSSLESTTFKLVQDGSNTGPVREHQLRLGLRWPPLLVRVSSVLTDHVLWWPHSYIFVARHSATTSSFYSKRNKSIIHVLEYIYFNNAFHLLKVLKIRLNESTEQIQIVDSSVLSSHSEVSWVTTAKDFCGELISGQSTSGRILVIYLKLKVFYAFILN